MIKIPEWCARIRSDGGAREDPRRDEGNILAERLEIRGVLLKPYVSVPLTLGRFWGFPKTPLKRVSPSLDSPMEEVTEAK